MIQRLHACQSPMLASKLGMPTNSPDQLLQAIINTTRYTPDGSAHTGFTRSSAAARRRNSIIACLQGLQMPHQGSDTHVTPAGGKVWDGSASQEDFMKKDDCILVDEQDNITGSGSKYEAHRFNRTQPQGLLHRAFSVFLFNEDNQLLLQQRACSKITFPGVWTNTCCSHQLHGYKPAEVDDAQQVSTGSVIGAKRAAVRKLGHELGIPGEQLPLEAFRYLTRLHYCAADEDTYGPTAEWGEHEIDYILFIKAHVDLKCNPDEVEDAKYVTEVELKEMMKPDSGLKWSPWFQIITERFLHQWWRDVDHTISSTTHVDLRTIHKVL